MSKAGQVRELVMYCLFRDEEVTPGETPDGAVLVKGIMKQFGFHPGRLQESKEAIKELLNQMPEGFHAATGGGWSFLQLCMDKDGVQWAEHPTMDELICLGIATGMAKFCLKRELWDALPGSMPYVVFNTESGDDNEQVSAVV